MTKTKPHIAVGIVCHGSEVLLIERRQREIGSDGNPIIWAFPGGKVEPGESAEQAAVREVYEETGNRIAALQTITAEDHPHYPVFISYIACELVQASIELTDPDPHIITNEWIPIDALRTRLSNHINPSVENYLQALDNKS